MGAHFVAQRIQPRGSAMARANRVDPAKGRGGAVRVLLWLLIAVFSLALVGQIAYHFVVRPRLTLARVLVEGDAILSEQQVIDAAGVQLGEPLLSADLVGVRTQLERCPVVRRAAVRRQLPDTLVVEIEARRGIATAIVATAEGSVPVLFDEEGLIFCAGSEAVARDLPVISGLSFARWVPGTRLPAVLRPLLDDLRRLQASEPALFAFISEVRVTPTSERDFELMIYPSSYATPVRVGGRISADVLRNAALLLDVVRRERLEGQVREVDLRAREVVYRERSGG